MVTSKYRYFLAVAEELNMSRAAEKSYISHQGISNAIRQLENEYGVMLFNRSPKLGLTPEGESMVKTLRQIQVLESNLNAQLHSKQQHFTGTLQVGITASNYDAIVPDMAAGFIEKYPYATLEVEPDFSINLEKKLLNGSLDLYIGAGHITTKNTKLVPLIVESYFFICSAKVLNSFFAKEYRNKIETLSKGSSLADFNGFPMIYYPSTDKLQQCIDACVRVSKIQLRKIFECKDSNVIVKLAARSLGGGIVTDFAIPAVLLCNLNCKPEDYLYIFPLTDLISDCDEISLVYHPDKYLSWYHLDFIDVLCNILDKFKPQVKEMLLENNLKALYHQTL